MTKKLQKQSSKITKRKSRKVTQTIAAIQTAGSMTKAAEVLGISRSALYDRITRYDLMPIIESIRDEAEATLIVASVDVAEDLTEVAKGNKQIKSVELQAKQDVLDRAGVTKKDNKGNINIASKDMSVTFEQV